VARRTTHLVRRAREAAAIAVVVGGTQAAAGFALLSGGDCRDARADRQQGEARA
jgi:hypothetical protein